MFQLMNKLRQLQIPGTGLCSSKCLHINSLTFTIRTDVSNISSQRLRLRYDVRFVVDQPLSVSQLLHFFFSCLQDEGISHKDKTYASCKSQSKIGLKQTQRSICYFPKYIRKKFFREIVSSFHKSE